MAEVSQRGLLLAVAAGLALLCNMTLILTAGRTFPVPDTRLKI